MFNKVFWCRVEFEFRRVGSEPMFEVFKKIFNKFLFYIITILLQPIALLFHFLGYRNVMIFSQRIGHLAIEPDCLLKDVSLGRIAKKKWIFLYDNKLVVNEHLYQYWSIYFITIKNPILRYLISAMSGLGLMKQGIKKYARVESGQHEAYKVYSLWGSRNPLVQLSENDISWGEIQISKLGIPSGSWFVCLHVRESGYSPIDENIQSYRNADIEKYFSAVRYITSKGGWVVRIGDPTSKKMPIMTNVVDYAHSKLKSQRLDIVLCAKANFILGSTSGICLVGTIFGVPVAIANSAPPGALGFGLKDLSIPKKIYDKKNSKLMSYIESLESISSGYRYASQYNLDELILVENSSEEILLLTKEMIGRLSSESFAMPNDAYNKYLYRSKVKNKIFSYNSAANIASFYIE